MQGAGSYRGGQIAITPISGDWKIGDNGSICTSMRLSGGGGGLNEVVLPLRCQVWFKNDGQYFLSDSDWDRGAQVLQRTLK